MIKKGELNFLYLSQEDMINSGVLDMHECIKTIEEGFKVMGNGDYLFGGPGENEHGLKLWFPKQPRGKNMPTMGPDRRVMAMIGYLGGDFNVCGEKWYGSNVSNPKEYGLPRSILIVVLNDVATGAPLAIMEGNLLSAMRTGAVPGVAAKYLARRDSKIIAIIGAGVISRTCLIGLPEVLSNLSEVKIFDIVRSKAETFAKEMSKKLGVKIHSVESCEEAIMNSDVISVAASGKNPPLIKQEWLKEGSFLALSAATAPIEDVFMNTRIVVDDWKMHKQWVRDQEKRNEIEPYDTSYSDHACAYLYKLIKENKIQENDIIDLSEIIIGRKNVRNNDKERIVFISGGLPMEDIAWGTVIYKNALKKNIGQKLTLWNKPYWI